MAEAAGVYSEKDAPLPPHLDGIPRIYSTGDLALLSGCSQRWAVEEVYRGRIVPMAVWVKYRNGRWEPHHYFDRAEIDRYLRSKGKPTAARPPRQLNLMLGIPGGKK